MTFSAAPDAVDIEFFIHYKITTHTSLRQLQITAPGIHNNQKFAVDIYDGTTKKGSFECDASRPVIIGRSVFDAFTSYIMLKIRLVGYDNFATSWVGDTSTTVWYYDKARADEGFMPIIIASDYRNKFENVLQAMFAGAFATTVTAAALEFATRLLASNAKLVKIIQALGVTVADAIATYAMVYKFAVDEGVRSWSDFTVEGLLESLTLIQTISTVGLAAGQAILMNTGIMAGKAGKIAGLAMGFGKNSILASAYLQYLGTVRHHYYPGS
jgi:hypothetical protein